MNSSDTVSKPSHEQVALRAELLWKAKGTPSGQDEQIWLEAERQLYDEAKEVFSNSAASTPSSVTSSTHRSSSPLTSTQPAASSNSAAKTQPSASVASEKMSGKSTPKSAARKK